MEAKRDQDFQNKKFAAALKGVDLDEPGDKEASTFEEVKRRAEAKLRGITPEALELAEIGIQIEGDD